MHFVDQFLVAAVFFGGVLLLVPFVLGHLPPRDGARFKTVPRWVGGGLLAVMVAGLIAWFAHPLLWPATPERIKRHVEAFDEAPFATASWRQWEIVAGWTVAEDLNPDLSGARRLLAEEIAGAQNSFILGSAFRVGLVRPEQLGRLRDYEERRHALLDVPRPFWETRPLLALEQEDWVIRAAVLRDDLAPGDRDYLAKRLHVTLASLSESSSDVLAEALLATRLLEAIQRPVDPARYRDRVQAWLRKFHSTRGGGFQVAGGFRQYLREPDGWVRLFWSPVGSAAPTADAVQLMAVYGIPEGLDLNWVRSFLRPRLLQDWTEDRWINAVTLDRLNRLPGVTRPTWLEWVYSERSLVMAVLLVLLCLYATLSSPAPRRPSPPAGRSG